MGFQKKKRAMYHFPLTDVITGVSSSVVEMTCKVSSPFSRDSLLLFVQKNLQKFFGHEARGMYVCDAWEVWLERYFIAKSSNGETVGA